MGGYRMMMGLVGSRAHRFLWIGALIGISLAPLAGCSATRSPDWIARGDRGMVASDHALASQAGLAMLRAGGNAVDAAIATSLALAVVRPESTGLGGGGFMIVRWADGECVALDYRERAPSAAAYDMFTQARAAHPERAPPSRYGPLAVAVPGQLAGLAEVQRRWGTLNWNRLTGPARRFADQGFAADQHYVDAARAVLTHYQRYPELRETCAYVYATHAGNGSPPQVGDRIRQPGMARLMGQIAARGPRAVYRDIFAGALAKTQHSAGGVIARGDITRYRVTTRQPLRGAYRDCEILTMPPPSSGGICLIETLNILDHAMPPNTAPDLAEHYLIEAMKHAFADRSRWLGDADFVPVPTDLLTARIYAQTLAAAVAPDRVQPITTYGAVALPDDAGTSHYCVVDRWGNCVVSTETINGYFGSLTALPEWGVILNNQMDDFTAEPGRANLFDLTQSERNAVAPGKRPLSSMTPTIVVRDGEPLLLVGASGGPRIISASLNVLVDVVDRDAPLRQAMTAPRVHHQWQPDRVYFDRQPPGRLADLLTHRGHKLTDERKTGMVQAIRLDGDRLVGASDPRKGGKPAGY
jgi:gamma-glutamyltranspeptidase/glutathione hydrolase